MECSRTMKYLRCIFAVTFLLVQSLPALAQTEGPLHGVVNDAQGAPVAGATVSVRPASAKQIVTDAKGAFAFSSLPSGVYEVTVQKAGYVTSEIANVAVPLTSPLDVALQPATFSTLEQIATVKTSANSPLNTSSSAIVTLDQSRFVDKGQIQIGHVLDTVPGIVSARPGTGNAAVPGSITSPNLRGALDYEKATLIDGHPLINGARGDYPTMLVNSLLFQDIEIVKGPTAYAPQINYGIGGTMNFRTSDPTVNPTGIAVLGFDNFSGTVGDLRLSDTIGKLGYVFNITSYGTQGPLNNTPTYVTLPYSSNGANTTQINGEKLTKNPVSPTPINGAHGPYPVNGVIGTPGARYTTLVACCQQVSSDYLTRGELAKLQYHVSDATILTAGYIGIQGQYDGPAGNLLQYQSTFAPATGYTTNVFFPGSQFLLNNTTTIPDQRVYDNEPMFEAELRTTVNHDTVLARYYSAVLERQTVSDWGNPTSPYPTTMTLYGTAFLNGSSTPTVFNGQPADILIPASSAYANNMGDHDYLHGVSFQYDHPMGDALATFAYDRNTSLTNSYRLAGGTTATTVTSIAPGTRQDFTTYLLRAVLPVTERGQLTLADYQNVYQNHYTPCCSTGGFTFADSTSTHNDPRLGFVYHLNPDASLRFSMGSAIAPPYPALIDTLNTTPAQAPPNQNPIVITKNAGQILPETSFGYDLGGDWRLRSGDLVSADLYSTNIWNQFVTYTYDTGTQFNNTPVYATTNGNLAQSRYEGFEVSLRRDPVAGWGYTFSADLQRAYAYNVPPGFYATSTNPYGTNLGVVPGNNYYSNGIGYNGISNKSEAYSMGYGAIHRRSIHGQFAELGLTYYGSNNTFNVPAFFVASATYRQPVGRRASVQLSADNLFSANNLSYNYYGFGSNAIPAPLANGQTGWRGQVPYGPATFRLMFIQQLGER
jgi:outer membrane receptor protein involved in Fe transport